MISIKFYKINNYFHFCLLNFVLDYMYIVYIICMLYVYEVI